MAAVGIDLGTTNSVIAAVNAAGKAEALRGKGEESPIVPSVVWFDAAGGIVVGKDAKDQQGRDDTDVASFFKRQMGDREWGKIIRGRKYSAIELSAEVLKRLKCDGEFALRESIRDVVITVPAYFYDPERKATEAAAELAGFKVLQLIEEPTAAAVAFGINNSAAQSANVLVYDLGGGTFDITLLRLDGKGIRVITSEGDAQLGGKDWDERIVNFIANKFREEFSTDIFADRTATGDLWIASENAKIGLTARNSIPVRIVVGGEKLEYELTREFFESLCADLTTRTIDLLDVVLERGKLKANQLDTVLLVGGSTRMPMVRAALEKHTGKRSSSGVNPDEAVGLGAALCAAGHMTRQQPTISLASGKKQADYSFSLASGKSVINVVPHSMGIIAETKDRSAYFNDIIIKKDEQIPRLDCKPYSFRTKARGENVLEIYLTQGEDSSPTNVKYLGLYVVPHVPHDPSGTATVDVVYSYNRGGIIDVSASLHSGQPLPIRVEPAPSDVPARFMVAPHVHDKFDPQSLELIVSPPGYDDIGSILGLLGLPHQPWNGSTAFGDILFLNCGSSNLPQGMDLRRYVEGGGCVYASDLTFPLVQEAFPGLFEFAGGTGAEGQRRADVLDQELKTRLGKSMNVTFDLPGWAEMSSVSSNANVLLRDHQTGRPLMAVGDAGAGKVFYTSFHTRSQSSGTERSLLQLLVAKQISAVSRVPIEAVTRATGIKI